jgi:hypothetical protein
VVIGTGTVGLRRRFGGRRGRLALGRGRWGRGRLRWRFRLLLGYRCSYQQAHDRHTYILFHEILTTRA